MSLPPPLPSPDLGRIASLRTDSDVRTLATPYALMAALQGLSVLLLGGFLAFGIHYEASLNAAGQGADRAQSGQSVIVMFSVMLALGLFLLLANVAAALALRRRRQLLLCKIAATLTCFGFPLDTALGVWTLLVLQRPAAIALFQDARR
ncbi:hypothetical protein [Xanthomonas translucens]|uniref:hypothetical protein n=1 Tax=Xanthomonas campestris pv. translucens TaxID=343 RepID=UPI0002A79B24|nr:hypothetical protein [Xanthomonas translucens]AKK68349.1 hypothetical protein FD63_13085 [Xanthomonas translucens pv. undulosa]ELQ00712.1 hypothetical protein A989_16568 [Xanthomonas translucens DAR61454]MBC3970903.1 hypothetical protein [Xanthomonas translucens pv. undulosa]MCT8271241.1 hypothetical protein [Xanthomonas translucens pv. undulosa]MCT8282936.1 hypothetical protein [Xanthomonas translucens pv. undulosa]